MKTIRDCDLADRDAEIFMFLAEGWTATHTVGREFEINNGPPEDLSILERLVEGRLGRSLDQTNLRRRCVPAKD